MSDVRFYFDVVCPYAYLGSTQIDALCSRAGARLEWRPMLLGGVFQSIGRKDAPKAPVRVRHDAQDLDRWARRWNVPLRFPDGHPRRTVDAMRLCVAAGAQVAEVGRALFRAYWVDGLDVTDHTVLERIAAAHGIDATALSAPETKQRLRDLTDEAVAVGVFGAPAFLVTNPHGQFLFWGQDRLDFVEKAIAGWKVPA